MNVGTKALEVGNDGVNLIKFRDTPCTCANGTTSWGCRPAVMNSPAKCYSTGRGRDHHGGLRR